MYTYKTKHQTHPYIKPPRCQRQKNPILLSGSLAHMALTRSGPLVPYNDTPPPPQTNPQNPTTQSKTADKGPQTQKRKRAGSKAEKDQPIASATTALNQKKARTSRDDQRTQETESCPPIPPADEQNHPDPSTPTRDIPPQTYSLPDNAGRDSPSLLPPSPTDEARQRKSAQSAPPPGKPPNLYVPAELKLNQTHPRTRNGTSSEQPRQPPVCSPSRPLRRDVPRRPGYPVGRLFPRLLHGGGRAGKRNHSSTTSSGNKDTR